RWVSPDGLIDLRMGRWQDVLADVEACDAVITDPPYLSAATAGGFARGNLTGRVASTTGYCMPYGGADEACLSDLLAFACAVAASTVVVANDFDGAALMRKCLKES